MLDLVTYGRGVSRVGAKLGARGTYSTAQGWSGGVRRRWTGGTTPLFWARSAEALDLRVGGIGAILEAAPDRCQNRPCVPL